MGCSNGKPIVDRVPDASKTPENYNSHQHSNSTRPRKRFWAHGNSSKKNKSNVDYEFYGLDIRYDDIEIRENLGSGTYGEVFKCRYRGKLFALKRVLIPPATVDRADLQEDREEMLEDFKKEVSLLSRFRHPRIVEFKGAVRTEPNYCLLFELCQGCVGTYLKHVRRRKITPATWGICVTISQDAAEAVEYLHSLEPPVIHRDLKAENLLLTSDLRCKLTDFGLSREYSGRKSQMTVCGTPCYVAPEIFRNEAYSEKIDCYSFGVVLWELFSGEKPYAEYDSVEIPYLVGKKGLRPPLLKHCPKMLNDLMQQCWQDDPKLRPSFTEIRETLIRLETVLKDKNKLHLPAHPQRRKRQGISTNDKAKQRIAAA